jgi:plastocyanin/heme-degrading monooxygenase HmoA
MEYVQTVLARISATKFDEASRPGGLLAELDAHSDFLSSVPGSRGMQVTRSANPEGDVLVVVETRWANNNAMADYSTREPNAAGILNKHKDLLAGAVEVHRMQAETAPRQQASAEVYNRLALALFVPTGVLAFALLVIYGVSRIYLVLPGEWATVMAACLAFGILLVSWYFATHPAVPRWQWAGVALVSAIALGIGGTAAGVYDENNHTVKTPEAAAPTAPAGGGTPVAPGEPVIDMKDNKFIDASGADLTTLTIKSGATIQIKNTGLAIHNVHVADASGKFNAAFCSTTGSDPCSKPAQVAAGTTATLTISLPAGTYSFRCDFHTSDMNGKLVVQ